MVDVVVLMKCQERYSMELLLDVYVGCYLGSNSSFLVPSA